MTVHQTIWLLMKQYDCSSNIMTIDETLWLFIKQYDCWWNNMIVHQIVWLFILSSKFQVPNDIINIHIITLESQIGKFVRHGLIYYTIETHT
jgi:hypothetical protein